MRESLGAFGLRPREVAAVLMTSTPESITACLAIAGESACAPLDPSLTEEEYVCFLSRLRASMLLIQADQGGEISARLPAVEAATTLGMSVLKIIPQRELAAGLFRLEVLESATGTRPCRQIDAALLLFTSSTTGRPKLSPLTGGNMHERISLAVPALELDARDRLLSLMPLFHGNGLTSVLTQLSSGGSVFLAPGFDGERLPAWWEEFRPTWLAVGVPLLHALATVAPRHPALFAAASPRFIRTTGAVPDAALRESIENWMLAPVLDGYGLTESGGTTRIRMGASRAGSVGTAVGTEIQVVDSSGNLLPPGEEGEIVLRGPAVVSGYLDDPDATRETFRNGWFHTGDIGHLDGDGFLFLTGRLKEIINRGSEKIIPDEVDRILAQHPDVKEAVVFAVPHRTLGEDVAAAVVLREGATLSESVLRQYAAVRLAAFKIPRTILFVDAIPRGPTGKPKRAALRERYMELAASPDTHVPARTGVEGELVTIWSRILANPQVSVEDDFFQLGGDSLAAALMLAEVDQLFRTGGELLNRAEFFDQPTIAALAQLLLESTPGDGKETSTDALESRTLTFQGNGALLPFFCIPAKDSSPYYLRHLSRHLGNERPFHVVVSFGPLANEQVFQVEELARRSIKAIRCIQPRGPYLLAGHCSGGVVAFETARQLISEGEAVVKLFLFDAPAPGYPKIAAQWKRYLVELPRILKALPSRGWAEIQEAGKHLLRLRLLIARRAGGRLRRTLPVSTYLDGFALWEYVPRKLAAAMVHFIAADQPVSTRVLDDPRYGWSAVARAGIEFRAVPGDHFSMLGPEHAPQLAGHVRSLLDEEAAGAAGGL